VGIEVDHVTIYRWVQRFTPLLADAVRFSPAHRWGSVVCRRDVREGPQPAALRLPGGRSVRAGRRCVRSKRRDGATARGFFERALATTKVTPVEVVTDQVAVYPGVLQERSCVRRTRQRDLNLNAA